MFANHLHTFVTRSYPAHEFLTPRTLALAIKALAAPRLGVPQQGVERETGEVGIPMNGDLDAMLSTAAGLPTPGDPGASESALPAA